MKTQTTHAAEQHAAKRRWLNAHEEGYHKAMGNRQVQMIAISAHCHLKCHNPASHCNSTPIHLVGNQDGSTRQRD